MPASLPPFPLPCLLSLLSPHLLFYPSLSSSSSCTLFWLAVRGPPSPLNSYTGTLQRSNFALLPAMKYLPHRRDIFSQCRSRGWYKGATWKTERIWKEERSILKLKLCPFFCSEAAEKHDCSVSILLNDVIFWQRINNASLFPKRRRGKEKSNRGNIKAFSLSSKQVPLSLTLPPSMFTSTLHMYAKLNCLFTPKITDHWWCCEIQLLLSSSIKYGCESKIWSSNLRLQHRICQSWIRKIELTENKEQGWVQRCEHPISCHLITVICRHHHLLLHHAHAVDTHTHTHRNMHTHTHTRTHTHTHKHTHTHTPHQQHQQRQGPDWAGWSQLVPANTFHCTLMTAGPPASVTLALTPLHGPPGIPQGQEGWGGGGGGVTQMREDTPGGGTALRELEVMNILTDRRGSNEFKLNYMCRAPHEHEWTRRGYFKGADIITPFRKFDKKEICVRQSEMQNTAA